MIVNKKPGLLEQNRAIGNKHDNTLTQKDDSVKANWLWDFRVRHQDIKCTEIADAIRLLFPGFDKTLLSKCMNPEKYGIALMPEAMQQLIEQFERSNKK